jgi:hypothetical protein
VLNDAHIIVRGMHPVTIARCLAAILASVSFVSNHIDFYYLDFIIFRNHSLCQFQKS